MEAVVTTINAWKKKLEVETSPEEVQPFIDKAHSDFQQKASIEGFRKGKAPLSIIRQRFGKRIKAEILDDLIKTFFTRAVEEKNLELISPGVIKDVSFEEGEPLKFTAEVEVEPEIQINDYLGLRVNREVQKVTKEDVQKTIMFLREQNAKQKPVNGGAEKGHIVEGDVQALDRTGVPIIGQKWENRIIELGSPPLGNLIQDQLLGVKVGEERRFEIIDSGKESDRNEPNRTDQYLLNVKSIQEKILPELNDDFAREIGDFQTVSDLENEIHKRLEEQREEEAERNLRQQIADEIIKRNDFEVPPPMIENALNNLWKNYQKQPQKEMDEKQFHQENRAVTVWNIKWYLLWHKIAEVQGITVSNKEIDEKIEELAKRVPSDEKKIRIQFKDPKRRDSLKEELLEEKVMVSIKENAKIKEIRLKKQDADSSRIIAP